MGIRILSAALLLFQLATASAAAQSPALPPALVQAKPESALASDLRVFEFRDTINPAGAQGSVTVAGERDGQPVFLAFNPKGSSNYGGINVQWKTAQPIHKGDVLFGRFTLRSLSARQESGESEGLFFFQKAKGERLAQAFSIGSEWTTVGFPMVASDDIPAGEGLLAFSFGNLEQSFEITGLQLLNFGKRLALADLPVTRFTYAGREADAAWRSAALARIEQLRTAPLLIKVSDARGQPLMGAAVEATLERPAFLWGSEVNADLITAKGPEAERYRAMVDQLFDTTVIGNGLKWPNWDGPGGREKALATIDWLNAHGKRVKGHNLVWPAWKFSPKAIARDPAARANIANLVEAHIADITAATKGKLIGWDVINEPVHETEYFQHMPRERMATWFQMVKKAEPALQLTLNEYGMLNRSSSPLFIKEFKDFATELRNNGAPIDVLGVQGHVGQTPRAPLALLADLDLLAVGGNQVQITEYDFNTPDEQLQADYNRDFLIALYSHPAVSGFIQWGFWQGSHWKPDAAMIRRDWSEKPSMRVWRDLVLGQWKTRVRQASDQAGEVRARGHLGHYRVRVLYQGKTIEKQLYLEHAGAELRIQL